MKWVILLCILATGKWLYAQQLLVKPNQFNQLLHDSSVQKLDVRSITEFDMVGHIPGFVQISIYDKLFEEKVLNKFDKTKPILVTCFSGHRSSAAVAKLKKMGFISIYELEGGLLNWMGSGYALE